MEQVIWHLAQKEGMCTQDVVREMELAIAIGRSNSDPAAKALWQSIPCKGEYPTPEELIVYLAQCALVMEVSPANAANRAEACDLSIPPC